MLIIPNVSWKVGLIVGAGVKAGAFPQVNLSEGFYSICKKGLVKTYMFDACLCFPIVFLMNI